jgi:hypothetical protein
MVEEAVSNLEASVSVHKITLNNIPEESHLHIHTSVLEVSGKREIGPIRMRLESRLRWCNGLRACLWIQGSRVQTRPRAIKSATRVP